MLNTVLVVWQDSEFESVIWYSLYGKTEDTNKIGSVAV